METRLLEYFLAIAETGTITSAAKKLHVTQPTLSRQLKALEADLQTVLFIREQHKMTLTKSGGIFQIRARQILSLVNRANDEVKINNDELTGTIAIGCIESTISEGLANYIKSFRQRFPLVKFELYDMDGNDIKTRLDQGIIDVGFVLQPAETVKYNFSNLSIIDHWGVIVSKNSKYAHLKQISAKQLTEIPLLVPRSSLVQNNLADSLGISTDELTIIGTQNLVTNSLHLCRLNIAGSLCASGALIAGASGLKFLPLLGARPIKHLMIWKKTDTLTEAVRQFIQSVQESPDN